jgi:hypothetical protein
LVIGLLAPIALSANLAMSGNKQNYADGTGCSSQYLQRRGALLACDATILKIFSCF